MYRDERQIEIQEREVKPNRLTGIIMIFVLIAVLVCWVLNELQIYKANAVAMRICGFSSLVLLAVILTIVFVPGFTSHSQTKYIVMFLVNILTMEILSLMYFYITVALVLPLMVAFQYRTKRVAVIGMIGSNLSALLAPVISYKLGMWDANFMAFLARMTGSVVTVNGTEIVSLAIGKVFLYISLPALMGTAVFSAFLMLNVASNEESLRATLELTTSGRKDVLTGLYNQNFFNSVLDKDVFRGKIGVIFMDVNGLKKFNDAHGHDFGNLLIRRSADSIREIVNDEVVAFRVGGDEFVVICEVDSQEEFAEIVEDWKKALDEVNEKNRIEYGGLRCSMSYGTAFGDATNIQNLVKDADISMYDDKRLNHAEGR